MRHATLALLASLAALLNAGCLIPQARFIHPTAVPIGDTDVIQGVGFVTAIQTAGMEQEQLQFRIRLLDAGGNPLKSADGKFQSPEGDVECARTLFVFENPWTLDDVRLDIPADQVEARADDFPLTAEMQVLRGDGAVLARERLSLPLSPSPAGEGPGLALGWGIAPGQPRAAAVTRSAARSRSAPTPDRQPPPRDAAAVASAKRTRPEPPPPAEAERPAPRREPDKSSTAARSAPRNAPPAVAESEPPPGEHAPDRAAAAPADETPRTAEREEPREVKKPAERSRAPEKPTSPRSGRRGDTLREVHDAPAQPSSPPRSERTRAEQRESPRREPAKKTTERAADANTVTVQSGDTLRSLAETAYGDGDRWLELYRLNRDQLTSVDALRAGMTLRLRASGRR